MLLSSAMCIFPDLLMILSIVAREELWINSSSHFLRSNLEKKSNYFDEFLNLVAICHEYGCVIYQLLIVSCIPNTVKEWKAYPMYNKM